MIPEPVFTSATLPRRWVWPRHGAAAVPCSSRALTLEAIGNRTSRSQDLRPRMLADAELRTNEMSRVAQSRRARVRHSQPSLQRRDVIRVGKPASVVWAASRTPSG